MPKSPVSIPFKREGSFRLFRVPDLRFMPCNLFQFPSNGKAHSDHVDHDTDDTAADVVSIPFKREGSFRHSPTSIYYCLAAGGVSIPFKREGSFRQLYHHPQLHPTENQFQFPSNGKAHSDWIVVITQDFHPEVSIPFKREGSFRLTIVLEYKMRNVFQFPSNGKAHSDTKFLAVQNPPSIVFPFPSNGKAHSD